MHSIKKLTVLIIFCSFLTACNETPATKQEQCIGLQRQMVMNQQYDHNYSSGVQHLRENNLAQQYHDLGCDNTK